MKIKVTASVFAIGISWLLVWATSSPPDLLFIVLIHSVTMFVVRLAGLVSELTNKRKSHHRHSTHGSPKWAAGHVAGCVLRAPEDVCICDDFQMKRSARPMATAKKT